MTGQFGLSCDDGGRGGRRGGDYYRYNPNESALGGLLSIYSLALTTLYPFAAGCTLQGGTLSNHQSFPDLEFLEFVLAAKGYQYVFPNLLSPTLNALIEDITSCLSTSTIGSDA